MILAAADYAEDRTQKPPPELSLAFSCLRWNCLPFDGGYLDQPAGLMGRMNAALNAYNAVTGRNSSKDWAAWAKANPQDMEFIQDIEHMRQANG